MFDGLWLDHYLQRFTRARAFGLHGTSPLRRPEIDVPTFVQGFTRPAVLAGETGLRS